MNPVIESHCWVSRGQSKVVATYGISVVDPKTVRGVVGAIFTDGVIAAVDVMEVVVGVDISVCVIAISVDSVRVTCTVEVDVGIKSKDTVDVGFVSCSAV